MNKKVLTIGIISFIILVLVLGGFVYLWNNRMIYPSMDEETYFFCGKGINYRYYQDFEKYDEWKAYILSGSESKVGGNLKFSSECYVSLRQRLDSNRSKYLLLKDRNKDVESIVVDVIKIYSSSFGMNAKDNLISKYGITEDEFDVIYSKITLELAIKYYERLFDELNISIE